MQPTFSNLYAPLPSGEARDEPEEPVAAGLLPGRGDGVRDRPKAVEPHLLRCGQQEEGSGGEPEAAGPGHLLDRECGEQRGLLPPALRPESLCGKQERGEPQSGRVLQPQGEAGGQGEGYLEDQLSISKT